jgi:hypothetical protein
MAENEVHTEGTEIGSQSKGTCQERWVTPAEHEFIRKSGDMDFCRLFTGVRYEDYGFEGGPYLGLSARI